MKHRILALLLIVALLIIPAATALAAPEEIFDVKFSGVVQAVPGEEGGAWTIAGYTVTTTEGALVKVFGAEAAEAGMWADVTAKRVSETEFAAHKLFVRQPELRLVGPLTEMPGETGVWVVAGIPVTVTEDTVLSDRTGPIEVGGWVEVHAMYDDAGVLTAVRVRAVEERDEVELWGALEAFSDTAWTISGIEVLVTEETKVMGTPKEGLLAMASATLEESGLVAKRLAVTWLEPKRGQMPAQFRGEIEALPEGGLIGTWTVGGRQVEVTEQTRIMQFKGLVEVGATVHVVGKTDGDVVQAFLIAVVSSPNAVRPFVVAGKIEALPEGGLVGEWTVKGETFNVTEQTQITGEAAVAVGALAVVQGVEQADGTRVATWVRVKDIRRAAPVGALQ